MNFTKTPRLVILALALLAAVPSFAEKRRAVNKPVAGAPFTATCQGTVVDAATGQPIAFASVGIGDDFKVVTSQDGTFKLANFTGFGSAIVTASRTGYNSASLTVTGTGTHDLNFRLQGRPAVTVKKLDGTTIPLDDDSVKFGYVILFGGYAAAYEDDFCMPDGTRQTVTLAQIKRVVGPATMAAASCCSAQAQKVRLELRNGTSPDATFRDSCDGYTVDVIGRNHVTGTSVFVPFTEVAEVVFP